MTVAFVNRSFVIFLSMAFFLGFLTLNSSANAQTTSSKSTKSSTTSSTASSKQRVEADYKGMVGLGLIGAELGFVIPTVCGLNQTWSLIVFPILGAGGGAAAGYFLLEKGNGHPTAAVATLVAGMALVIPAAVITVMATSYSPEDEPAPVAPSGLAVKVKAQRLNTQQLARAAGPGLLRWSPEGVFLGAPAITPVISGPTTTSKGFVLQPRSELRVALVSGRF
jgi:F0F1-type ATP synthase assembly protein I